MSDILFEELVGHGGRVGHITLNRPQVLNTLTLDMCVQLTEKLQQWQTNETIKAVMITGVGERAFCAGGDIRKLHEANVEQAQHFFLHEYRMNKVIYHFNKPYIALLDGISMGGGLGVSVHGSHRVATDRLLLAMPETAIGFFPDVGASYFLPRLPGKLGCYLGLTGARLNANDSYYATIANHVVSHQCLHELVQKIVDLDLSQQPYQRVSDSINFFALELADPELAQHSSDIDRCFAKNTIEEIITALTQSDTSWCQQQAEIVLQKSPVSLKVTLAALQRGALLNFDECMQMELQLSGHFLQHHDFYEGVRAALIDKDRQPHWRPSALHEVTDTMVAEYFQAQTTTMP